MGFYLLFAICFGTHFASCDNFDKPVLIQSFNYFSLFFLMLLFWLFCFDFICNDKLYLFNQMIQLIFIVCSICVLACSRDFLLAKKFFKYEYDILLFFVFFSAIALCFSTEFLLIYLTIELQSLAFYVFATFCRNSEFSTEAGLKYFVFGGLISCFLLLGLSLIYLYFGSLSFELIFSIINFNHDSLFFSGFLFVLCVFLFKLGSTPFHFWLPDVYEGSILSVTMLFACLPKIVLFGVFFKLCFFVFFDFNDT
jgi:NADH-quinone oxidoreductase subunit N